MSQPLSAVVYKLQNGPAEALLAAIKAAIQMDDDDILADLTDLPPIVFSGFPLEQAALIQVIKAIRELKYQDKFETLMLQDVQLTDQALQGLVSELTVDMKKLKRVFLARNALTSASFPTLLNLIQNTNAIDLWALDLSQNKIGSDAALELCRNFRFDLDLSDNTLGSEFATKFIALIKRGELRCSDVNLIGTMSSEDLARIEAAVIAARAGTRVVLYSDHEQQLQLDVERVGPLAKFRPNPQFVGALPLVVLHSAVQSILQFASSTLEIPELAQRVGTNIRFLLGKKSREVRLNLGDSNIGLGGYQVLAEVLEHNLSLESLEIRDSALTPETFTVLLEGLKKNSTLKCLTLSKNPLSSELLVVLIAALPTLNIETLDFGQDRMTNEDFARLAGALSHNRHLKTIICPNFTPTTVGLAPLLTALETNFTLQSISSWKCAGEVAQVQTTILKRLERNIQLVQAPVLVRVNQILAMDPQSPNLFPSLKALAQKVVDEEKARVAEEVAKIMAESDRKHRDKQLIELRVACERDHKRALEMINNTYFAFMENELEEPLKLACRHNNTQLALACIKYLAPVNTKDGYGHSPLWWAYWYDNQEMKRALLDCGATPLTAEEEAAARPPKSEPKPKVVETPSVLPSEPVRAVKASTSTGSTQPEPPPTKKLEEELNKAVQAATNKYLQYHQAKKSEKNKQSEINRGHGDGWFSWLRHGNKGLKCAKELAKFSDETLNSKSVILKAYSISIFVQSALKKSSMHRHSLSSYLMDEICRQKGGSVKDRYTQKECFEALESYKPS